MNSREQQTLENYLTRYGLVHVLETLTHICFSKSAALNKATPGHDPQTIHMSHRWDQAGLILDDLSTDPRIISTLD